MGFVIVKEFSTYLVASVASLRVLGYTIWYEHFQGGANAGRIIQLGVYCNNAIKQT